MQQIKLAFFGDSICFGQGVAIHKGWVPRISESLSILGEKTGHELLVANAGVNGNTTRLALERMPYDIQSHRYEILLIQFGMNDCNYWLSDNGLPRVSPLAFEANLIEIIDRALAFGAKHIVLNTNHPTTRVENYGHISLSYQESNAAYNKIIRSIPLKRPLIILNDIEMHMNELFLKKIIKPDEIVLPDRLHLSALGHDIYYKKTFPILEELLLKLLE